MISRAAPETALISPVMSENLPDGCANMWRGSACDGRPSSARSGIHTVRPCISDQPKTTTNANATTSIPKFQKNTRIYNIMCITYKYIHTYIPHRQRKWKNSNKERRRRNIKYCRQHNNYCVGKKNCCLSGLGLKYKSFVYIMRSMISYECCLMIRPRECR